MAQPLSAPDRRRRLAIVLPEGFAFCALKPHSIETFVRGFLREPAPDEPAPGDDVRVFCAPGARQRDHIACTEIAGTGRQRLAQLKRALEQFDPDYVEFHHQARAASTLARALGRAACVLFYHNRVRPPRHVFERWLHGHRLRAFDHIIFASNPLRLAFLCHWPNWTGRASSVPTPAPHLPATSVCNRQKLIVFAGRAVPEKGLGPLCDALCRVLPQLPDWRACLFLAPAAAVTMRPNQRGDDVLADWLGAQCAKLAGVKSQVTIAYDRPREEVLATLSEAEIAIIPSLVDEGLGLAALEAHAAGVAVISSGRGGLRQVSGDHAHFLPVTDSHHIEAALLLLAHDAQLRQRLQAGGEAMARTRHSLTRRRAQLDELRHDLIARRSAAAVQPVTAR